MRNSASLPSITWYEVLSTGFFSGYLPKAPGTWGSLFAVLIFFLTSGFFTNHAVVEVGRFHFSWWAIGLGIVTTFVGIVSSGLLAAEWQADDPQPIVIDEFAGMFLACSLIQPTLPSLVAAFILFRLFDTTKPGPIGRIQDLPGGQGIVLDDVLAGIFAAPLAAIFEFVFNKYF